MILFSGIFFEDNVFDCIRDLIPVHDVDVATNGQYHVTCCFKPNANQVFPEAILGENVSVKVTHIMRGDGITAVAVEIPKMVKPFYHGADNVHITVGFNPPHKPVESGKIEKSFWEEITPFIIEGKIGYMETK